MKIYSREVDQISALRHFFIGKGKILIYFVLVVAIALLIWGFVAKHQENRANEASKNYGKLFSSKAVGAKRQDELEKFVNENHNIYGVLASLDLAKRYVEMDEFEQAIKQLKNSLMEVKDSNLAAIINIRLARIQLQQKKVQEALKTLDNVKEKSWSALIADLRGDALLAEGNREGALDAWRNGITSGAPPALQEMIQMKINNLG